MNADPNAASSTFCVTVDADGVIRSVEAGDAGSVPSGLLEFAGKFVADRVEHVSFVWSPPDATEYCRVALGLDRVEIPGPAAVMSGRFVAVLPYELTRRELDVLTLITAGFTNTEIALRLGLSSRTVTTHVDRVLRKLHATTRTAAASIAHRDGLLRLPLPAADACIDNLQIGQLALGRRSAPVERAPRLLKRPLVVGAILPLSGFGSADGTEMANASQLAVEEINHRGGIGGREVRMDIAPVDIMSSDSIRDAMHGLLERDVTLVTSGYLSHQEIAHEMAADSGIPYLHNATMRAMEERVLGSPERYGRTFQVCPSDAHYAPRFVEVMTDLRDRGLWRPSSRTLVVIEGAWDLSDLGVAQAAQTAAQDGWVLEVIRADAEAGGWAAVADQLRRTEPAAAMLGHYLVDGTVELLDAFMDDPSDTLLYSVYAPSVPEFRELMGHRAEGILWATVTGTYSDHLARGFAERYLQRFGRAPGRSHAGIAYDRINVIASAWSQMPNPQDPAVFAQAVKSLVHRGVNGVYYFGGTAQTALSYSGPGTDPSLAQAHLVFQIQQGQHRILGPSPYADAEFRVPSWLTRSRVLRRSA